MLPGTVAEGICDCMTLTFGKPSSRGTNEDYKETPVTRGGLLFAGYLLNACRCLHGDPHFQGFRNGLELKFVLYFVL
jgi:hypothetical protein